MSLLGHVLVLIAATVPFALVNSQLRPLLHAGIAGMAPATVC